MKVFERRLARGKESRVDPNRRRILPRRTVRFAYEKEQQIPRREAAPGNDKV
jgi:hypothetical protein